MKTFVRAKHSHNITIGSVAIGIQKSSEYPLIMPLHVDGVDRYLINIGNFSTPVAVLAADFELIQKLDLREKEYLQQLEHALLNIADCCGASDDFNNFFSSLNIVSRDVYEIISDLNGVITQ